MWKRCGESKRGWLLARELTKLHEEFLRGTAGEVRRALSARERVRGEMVLLIEATSSAQPANVGGSVVQQVSQLMG